MEKVQWRADIADRVSTECIGYLVVWSVKRAGWYAPAGSFVFWGLVQAFFATWLLIAQIIVFALTGGNGYSLTLVSF